MICYIDGHRGFYAHFSYRNHYRIIRTSVQLQERGSCANQENLQHHVYVEELIMNHNTNECMSGLIIIGCCLIPFIIAGIYVFIKERYIGTVPVRVRMDGNGKFHAQVYKWDGWEDLEYYTSTFDSQKEAETLLHEYRDQILNSRKQSTTVRVWRV